MGWRSPSNIALVKYWGKYGSQLPRNPSISFTLSQAFTETIIQYESIDYAQDQIQIDFYFEGKPNEAFKLRIESFLNDNIESFPFLRHLHLSVESRNSFPHSSGIASSASSMSALCLCIASLSRLQSDKDTGSEDFLRRASSISRLASGSACRSVYPEVAAWGHTTFIEHSHDEYAVPITGLHENYRDYHDDILIISVDEKSVSSTAGHKLMDTNPFADQRYNQAKANMGDMYAALLSGDTHELGRLMESEALTLHALMMCSDPSFILMKANTLHVIEKIRQYRQDTGHALYFTLDAGPNVHLLYPHSISSDVLLFVNSELRPLCQDQKIIHDRIGQGPVQIKSFSL